MGEGVVLISLKGVVLGDLLWGTIGRSRGGGGSVMVVFLYFLYIAMLFFGERETGEAGKIRSDLKKCNESWSL